MASRASPSQMLRRRIASEVVGFFNNPATGFKPVRRSVDALIPPGSVAWRVHGDLTTMMVGGVAALLLQMLHPSALAGVWDHSDFRRDMHGRLRNTARFIAVTTYAAQPEAQAAIARVRRIHDHVNGSLPDGRLYDANDPRLLAWVHVAGGAMFLASWMRFAEPGMSPADRDFYWADIAPIARLLGADPVPVTAADAAALIDSFRIELRADQRTTVVRRAILKQPPPNMMVLPVQAVLMHSAIDLLPDWARRMHGLRGSGVGRPALGALTSGLRGTLHWAFRG